MYQKLTQKMQAEERDIMVPRSRSVPYSSWNEEKEAFVLSKEEVQNFQYELNYYVQQRNELYLRYEAQFNKERDTLHQLKAEKIK